jgi:hypothetical protein
VTIRAGAQVLLVCALALAGSAPDAGAHGRSTSTSVWTLEPGPVPAAGVLVRVRLSDLQRAVTEAAGLTAFEISVRPAAGAAVDAYLTGHVSLYAGSSRCAVRGPVLAAPSADPTHMARRWRVECEAPGPPVLRVDPFFEVAPQHFHLARATRGDGEVLERIFVLESPTWALGEPGSPSGERGASFAGYLRLGVEHIATGVDHLLFLLALLLVGVSVLEVATIVTGFTVAHSMTLALGVLGVVEPRSAAIEALIGLSIAVVALENFAETVGPATRRWIVAFIAGGLALAALGAASGAVAVPALALIGVAVFALCYLELIRHVVRPGRLRWFVAFVFGLIHGFGFAGLLTQVGLPPDRLAPALLGFNLGVEIGQIVLVALAWPILLVVERGNRAHRVRVVQLCSAPILAAGLYWFLSRSLG